MLIDVLVRNARIRTLDTDRPHAQSFGVLHGRIVGFDEQLHGTRARHTIDLGGAPVLPGFHDAHFHTKLTGARLASLRLRPDSVSTLDELYGAVRTFAAERPEGAYVIGAGYDQNVLGGHPSAEALDLVAGGRPVILEHVSGHMLVMNTEAFTRAGYPGRRDVPDIVGGHVARDHLGVATGLLQENAMELGTALTVPETAEDIQHHLALASSYASRNGLTSLTEPGGGAPFGEYLTAIERGTMQQRLTVMPWAEQLHDLRLIRDDLPHFGFDEGIRTGFGDDRLRLGPVKFMSDGSLIGKSAAMTCCYHGEPDNLGFMRWEPDVLRERVLAAHHAGWNVAIHAIGDAAVDHSLTAIEHAQSMSPRAGARHRIEHFAVASDEQVARAARLGVIAVPQGRFISEFGDGMAAALGPERTRLCYRMRSLIDAGMVLPGSTDSPVSDGEPLMSMHDMVNRTTQTGAEFTPSERITVEQAVRAYTYGSAYAVRQEQHLGSLTVGKLADAVVLSDDLFEIAPDRIRTVTVGATLVGGEVAFDDGAIRTSA